MYLQTLGNAEVEQVALQPKQLLLLSYIHLNGPQSRARLAELFWPDKSPRSAKTNLRTTLSRIQQASDGLLEVSKDVASSVNSDIQACQAAYDQGDYTSVIDMTNTSFLHTVDLASLSVELAEWVLQVREQVMSLRQLALIALAKTQKNQTQAAQHYAEAFDLNDYVPLEPDVLQAMYPVLKAVQHPYYPRVKVELTELGLDANATKEIHASTSKPVLPKQLSTFIGRQTELQRLKTQATTPETRLVSLIGLGGSGKTRLSLELAYELTKQANTSTQEAHFADGIYWIGLESATTTDEALRQVALHLNVDLSQAEDVLQEIVNTLEGQQILMILDNLEQVRGIAVPIEHLLTRIEGLTILVTSREPLGLKSEWFMTLSGLETAQEATSPEGTSEAVELFMQRALQQGYTADSEDRDIIGQICSLVDGSPLAIELAAAWTSMLNLDEILQELQQSFELLSQELHDVPERHYSIRAMFNSSWQLLEPYEQHALCSLGIFQDGFTAEAARQVAGISLTTIRSLVKKSLINRVERRFVKHPLISFYIREKLDESPALRIQLGKEHANYYESVVHQAYLLTQQIKELEASKLLTPDFENIRYALMWLSEQNSTLTWPKVIAELAWYWDRKGLNREGLTWSEKALKVLSHSNTLRGDIHLVIGTILLHFAELDRATIHLEKARHIANKNSDLPLLAKCYIRLAENLHFSKGHGDAIGMLKQACTLYKELQDKYGLVRALTILGDEFFQNYDYINARNTLNEAYLLGKQLSLGHHQLRLLYALCNLSWSECNWTDLEFYLKELDRVSSILNDTRGRMSYHRMRVQWLASQSRYLEIDKEFEQLLAISLRIEDKISHLGNLTGKALHLFNCALLKEAKALFLDVMNESAQLNLRHIELRCAEHLLVIASHEQDCEKVKHYTTVLALENTKQYEEADKYFLQALAASCLKSSSKDMFKRAANNYKEIGDKFSIIELGDYIAECLLKKHSKVDVTTLIKNTNFFRGQYQLPRTPVQAHFLHMAGVSNELLKTSAKHEHDVDWMWLADFLLSSLEGYDF